jgi:hypothetical protein
MRLFESNLNSSAQPRDLKTAIDLPSLRFTVDGSTNRPAQKTPIAWTVMMRINTEVGTRECAELVVEVIPSTITPIEIEVSGSSLIEEPVSAYLQTQQLLMPQMPRKMQCICLYRSPLSNLKQGNLFKILVNLLLGISCKSYLWLHTEARHQHHDKVLPHTQMQLHSHGQATTRIQTILGSSKLQSSKSILVQFCY